MFESPSRGSVEPIDTTTTEVIGGYDHDFREPTKDSDSEDSDSEDSDSEDSDGDLSDSDSEDDSEEDEDDGSTPE